MNDYDENDELDQDETDEPEDDPPPPQPQGAPVKPKPPRKPRRGPVPEYLRELVEMPGVGGADVLEGVDLATAWVRAESSNGIQKTMPVAYLAPRALDTLADYGLEGHTTFELRNHQQGAVVRYFATVLDPIEDDEPELQAGDGGAPAPDRQIIELLTRQQRQIDAMQLERQQMPPPDPFAGFEKVLELVARVNQTLARVLPQPAAPAGGMGGIGEIIDVVGRVVGMARGGGDVPDLPPEPPAGGAE